MRSLAKKVWKEHWPISGSKDDHMNGNYNKEDGRHSDVERNENGSPECSTC